MLGLFFMLNVNFLRINPQNFVEDHPILRMSYFMQNFMDLYTKCFEHKMVTLRFSILKTTFGPIQPKRSKKS